MELAVDEVAFVLVPVEGGELAEACLGPIDVVSFVSDLAELEQLDTLAVLLVHKPVPIVQSALFLRGVDSLSMSLALFPLSLVNVA